LGDKGVPLSVIQWFVIDDEPVRLESRVDAFDSSELANDAVGAVGPNEPATP